MTWIDWCITIIPVTCVLALAVYSRKYVRGVADFLAAGRVAGRYVISVGDLEAGLGLYTLVMWTEVRYKTGYALIFWESMVAPLSIVMALTGYCVYRYRETKALSIGQFMEMRYSRPFRIFASLFRAAGDTLTNAIGPAVAANFFIYYLGMPHSLNVMGTSIPMFAIVMIIGLSMAVLVMWMGGRISLLITDSIQGLMSYPIFVIITVYVLSTYSWGGEMAPVMLDRAPGESFLNPFDIEHLRDFNLFALAVAVLSRILNRASWFGNDTSGAGRNPHEQKMAGVLGAWRNGFATMMTLLVAITVITVMSHQNHAAKAHEIRQQLSAEVIDVLVPDAATREKIKSEVVKIPEQYHRIGVDAPLSQKLNLDTPYIEAVSTAVGEDGEGNFVTQQFRVMYHQMMLAVSFRQILPIGMLGIFCLLMVMFMISTDTSRIFNCSSTILQDIIMPMRKTPMTPEQHVHWLRMSSLAVAVFFFIFSQFFIQIDYILMFTTIMAGVWLGGAGPVLVFGLYSRFGNTVGAFGSMIVGSGIPVFGIIFQRNWADSIYPYIDRMGWTQACDTFLRAVSSPLSPYVEWQMNAVKFPINSTEIFGMALIGGFTAYVGGSLLTYRKPYNLDRMLHRGKYSIDGVKHIKAPWTWRSTMGKLIGITPEYTKGDRIIAWSMFAYTFVYQILFCFLAVLVWNIFDPWPAHWWSNYFLINSVIIGGVIGAISTVWFMVGGVIDLRQLFKDLAARVDNPLDDGRVQGHVSLMDVAALGADAEDEDAEDDKAKK
ncbi:MAG: sodium:panthothenate symporter [Opitutaceae bacterium]|nr:sodium:panthothenate symporter [Opitutaceae bacterium]